MLTDRNYWATYRDAIATWNGELPPPTSIGIERVFEFERHILEAAEREQVMRILESPRPFEFKRADGWTWLDWSRAKFERQGRLVLFPGGGPARQTGGRLSMLTRLAYYQGGQIVEEDIEDIGALRQAVVAGKGGDEGTIRSYTPLSLDGAAPDEEGEGPGHLPTREPDVSLSLFTDIWFPRVVGLGVGDDAGRDEVWHPARGRDGMMDNSALAARHTPRLNRFIETLRDAVLELGGTWNEVYANPSYRPMVHSGGILLDHPAGNA